MLNIDFAEKSYSGMQSPGEIGVADGEEKVRPVMLSMLAPL